MSRLTHLQTDILEQLAQYTYLTNSQLMEMGIGHIKTVSRITKHLQSYPSEKTPAVGILRPGHTGRIEGQENVLYLTEYGAVLLGEALGIDPMDIPFPAHPRLYERDYWHRKHCIDFQIRLWQALQAHPELNLKVRRFDRYFDKTGANRTGKGKGERLRSLTRADFSEGGHIIPDANFILERLDAPERQALYAFEMTHQRDTKRVLEQIEGHVRALEAGTIAEKYGLRQGHRVLFVFAEKELMEAVIRRLDEARGMAEMTAHFLFAQHVEVMRDTLTSWRYGTDRTQVHLVTGRPIEPVSVSVGR